MGSSFIVTDLVILLRQTSTGAIATLYSCLNPVTDTWGNFTAGQNIYSFSKSQHTFLDADFYPESGRRHPHEYH